MSELGLFTVDRLLGHADTATVVTRATDSRAGPHPVLGVASDDTLYPCMLNAHTLE